MRKGLEPGDLGDLLSRPSVAILATRYPDGSMLLAPVWHEWTDGGFTLVLDGNDAKIRNLRRDPRVSIVVADDEPPYRGIELRGLAKFVATNPVPVLRRLAERFLTGRDVDGYVNRMSDWSGQAVVVRVEPCVLRAWDFADEEW